MACAVCSGNSTCWSLKLPTALLSGEIQAQKSHLCKFAQLLGCRPVGPCFPHPLFSASVNRNGRRAISGLLGREKKAGPGRRNAQDGPGEGQRAWEGRRGWNQRQIQLFHHDAWAIPDSAASGCRGGNWGFGQPRSSLRSWVEERAQPSASNHHMGLFHTKRGAGVKDLRSCVPFHSGALSLKGSAPLLSVVFSSFPLWK